MPEARDTFFAFMAERGEKMLTPSQLRNYRNRTAAWELRQPEVEASWKAMWGEPAGEAAK